jgi:hypothetical protein
VRRCFQLGDLHLGHGETSGQGTLLEPSGEEWLARAVFAADRFEARSPAGNGVQLGVHGVHEPVQPDGEDVKAAGGHRAAA